jgi:hypothetical protein
MEKISKITIGYLAKNGVLIALNSETGLTEFQKIDEPETFAIENELPFLPKQLDNDDEAIEIVHNISQITLDDETITSSMREIIIEDCYDLIASF